MSEYDLKIREEAKRFCDEIRNNVGARLSRGNLYVQSGRVSTLAEKRKKHKENMQFLSTIFK